MIWVYRPGKSSFYYNDIIKREKIYLIWDNIDVDCSECDSISDFKQIIIDNLNPNNRTTISNLGSQLKYFCKDMKIGEYILIPSRSSKWYTLAQITGNYEYKIDDYPYSHSRKIKILIMKIDKNLFSQKTQFSLGAFRTIFHARQENEIIRVINDIYNIKLEG